MQAGDADRVYVNGKKFAGDPTTIPLSQPQGDRRRGRHAARPDPQHRRLEPDLADVSSGEIPSAPRLRENLLFTFRLKRIDAAMADATLIAERRTAAGKGRAGRVRREGLVPAVVYGLGDDNVSVTVSPRELGNILSARTGANTLITLQIDGTDELASPARSSATR